jgi:hypothetical protein
MQLEQYIEYWRKLKVDGPQYVHEEDRRTIFEDPYFSILKEGHRGSNLDKEPGKTQLHLKLLPAPHTGSLEKARIFLVSLNPSVNVTNYDDEANDEFRDKLIAQIHQRLDGTEFPLMTLDPAQSLTGGYEYANKSYRFGRLLNAIAESHFSCKDDPELEARRWLAQNVATIEVMPYKSKNYSSLCDRLRSFEVAKELLDKYLRPKALNGELLVIVTRKLKELGLKYENRAEDFVLYHPTARAEARRAHLTPCTTDGGNAILRWAAKLLD